MTHEVVRTRGGALAMRSIVDNEVMHPGVGPLVEAAQLYVGQARIGQRLRAAGRLVLFDVGLGAGSNALAARAVAEAGAGKLEMISFERDLGALELALAHPADFGLEGEPGVAARALLAEDFHESAQTRWSLRRGELLPALAVEPTRADVVFWDAFSPRVNPELWTVAAFRAIRAVAGPGCTMFTFSASTATRVAMLLAGWAVGVGDAISGKAQTTAAAVSVADLARPLPRSWLARLERPDAPMPSDAPIDATDLIAALPQFA